MRISKNYKHFFGRKNETNFGKKFENQTKKTNQNCFNMSEIY
jgi:hypothetical protein